MYGEALGRGRVVASDYSSTNPRNFVFEDMCAQRLRWLLRALAMAKPSPCAWPPIAWHRNVRALGSQRALFGVTMECRAVAASACPHMIGA